MKSIRDAIKILVVAAAMIFTIPNAFATPEDGVPALGENPTEEEKEKVRKGAEYACEEVEDDNERQECVVDYYAEHNLEEEPSCD